MKKYLLLSSVIAVVMLFLVGGQITEPNALARENPSINNYQSDTDNCLVNSAGWDKVTRTYSRFKVNSKNGCTSSLDIRICIQKDDGKWTCGLKLDVKPGDSSQFGTLKTTERYKVMSRRAGSKYRFPEP